MIKSDILIANFYNKQNSFGYLQSINLSRSIDDIGCSEYFVCIILCSYPFYEGDRKLSLKFSGVKNLKVGDLDGLFKLTINVTDISERQMEGISYKVSEQENDLFSFYCDVFEYEEVIETQ